MNFHFSKRLGRCFQDEDLLTKAEAIEVLLENSGLEKISDDYLSTQTRRGLLHPEYPYKRVPLYPYKELRDWVVRPTRGRRTQDVPSWNAERQRRYRERHGRSSKKSAEGMTASAVFV
jgi:hypothetical protein